MSHAAENNVQAIALTDHDDIAGLSEASITAKSLNIIFINGVEISVTWKKRTLHIVGLSFDKDKDTEEVIELNRWYLSQLRLE